LKKGDRGGFEFNLCHRVEFLNELLRRHGELTDPKQTDRSFTSNQKN
jgi:hypothetical protein